MSGISLSMARAMTQPPARVSLDAKHLHELEITRATERRDHGLLRRPFVR
jgi:hypothetical protein